MIASANAGNDAVIAGHKEIGHRISVAAGATEPHHVPALTIHRRRGTGKDYGPLHGAAVGVLQLCSFFVAQPTMPTKPRCTPVPSAKSPDSVDDPAAVH